jgi:hypothetical protein
MLHACLVAAAAAEAPGEGLLAHRARPRPVFAPAACARPGSSCTLNSSKSPSSLGWLGCRVLRARSCRDRALVPQGALPEARYGPCLGPPVAALATAGGAACYEGPSWLPGPWNAMGPPYARRRGGNMSRQGFLIRGISKLATGSFEATAAPAPHALSSCPAVASGVLEQRQVAFYSTESNLCQSCNRFVWQWLPAWAGRHAVHVWEATSQWAGGGSALRDGGSAAALGQTVGE